ncbi:glycoside hydrolase family 25 protein [Faunimonas sp. B44]|uniref:glycoside hydrolase family 25 protein n=1 Tax=Faunimonas sp. B44 TaxID=3461493 RepID=UPI004044F167
MPFRFVRAVAALAIAVLVSSCAGKAPHPYPTKGDSDPHPGVARAHYMPVQGIDVSKYQGDIDWVAVRNAGTKFAFIKATEGGDHVDSRFYDNWEGARRAGVPRGAYHFMYWCRPAIEQAFWFTQAVPYDPSALPPVLDLEWNGHSINCPKKLPREQALEKIRIMLAEMQAHTGKQPIIYTDITFHREVLEGEFPHHHFWLRSVAAEPHERYNGRRWALWQFTATGRVPGIKGPVDRNAFVGSPKEWDRWLKSVMREQRVFKP